MDEEYSRKVGEELSADPVGSNVSCPYYPCHQEGQDCTFCFCPFYPCMDTSLGETIIGRRGNPVWSCKYCMLPHRDDVTVLLHSSLRGRWPCAPETLGTLFDEAKRMEERHRREGR